MFKVSSVVVATCLLITYVSARIDYHECEHKPTESQCIIETSGSQNRVVQRRYVYDWDEKKCNEIKWLTTCGTPAPDTNNFLTEFDCMNECSGWA
ncbi:hypothetical protein evm_007542 [Chilo suppressalis]|nr:hypothetical protein evm_007542 [Chilo suppressalis]